MIQGFVTPAPAAWGDPTLFGWAITAGYGLAAGLLYRRYRQATDRRERAGGLFLAVVMLALGLNKQMDLQLWLGWWTQGLLKYFEASKSAQTFVKVAGLSGMLLLLAGAIGAMTWLWRGVWSRQKVLAAGLVLLGVFAACRTAAILRFLPPSNMWVIAVEALGLGLVLAGACQRSGGRSAD